MIPTFLLVTLTVFLVARFVPGSALDLMAAQSGSAGGGELTRANLEKALGLDLPVHIQYVRWLGNLFRGDLGTNIWERTPVREDVLARLPVSFELGLLALLTSLVIALPIGVYSAIGGDAAGLYPNWDSR
jgi:peptide/nickel transport system permease protein